MIHLVSVSGGKDSTATLLLALKRFGHQRVRAAFCDTDHEHELTNSYLDTLERTLGLKIVRLRANFDEEIRRKRLFIARDRRIGRDAKGRKRRWTNKAKRRALAVLYPTGNPFLDLCLWKGRFPSRLAQFCTEELKRNILVMHQLELVDAGHTVISWQGLRRDESTNRRNVARFERLAPGLYAYRPLVDWTAAEVIGFCVANGVGLNSLYRQGMNRVGCMPCINCAKSELSQIASRYPDHIDRVEDWEARVSAASKRGWSTLHHVSGSSLDRRIIFKQANIHARVEWSKTSRGGRQYDLFAVPSDLDSCASAYGLCE